MKFKISKGKFAGLNACANELGTIAALAVDHRDNLRQAIASARGEQGTASAADMLTFKARVVKVLTLYASAVLLDPEYGLGAVDSRAAGTGLMLAYEKSGYDFNVRGRLPDLLPEWSVRRLVEAGAQAIKILLYYNPFDEAYVNTVKQSYVERIGAECLGLDVPFFLEPLVYDELIGDERGLAFARQKPEYVARTIEEFSRERYAVDVLKVELPINPAFIGETTGEQFAYTREEAMEHLRRAASAASKPFIYLSGGMSNAAFCDMLELAAEVGVKCSGVLCGRATWQEGIAVYAREGVEALECWLAEGGTQNIQTINNVLTRSAVPWWERYGGKENIEVIG